MAPQHIGARRRCHDGGRAHRHDAKPLHPPACMYWLGCHGMTVGGRSDSSILHSQFCILNSAFSILHSQFCILNSAFSILNSQFSILNSHPHIKHDFERTFAGRKRGHRIVHGIDATQERLGLNQVALQQAQGGRKGATA